MSDRWLGKEAKRDGKNIISEGKHKHLAPDAEKT